MELLLTYGELLSQVSPEFERFVNSGLFASKLRTKGDKDVCAFIHGKSEEEVEHLKEWEEDNTGKSAPPPLMRYCDQLEEVGESLGMNVWKTRSLVRLYVEDDCFGNVNVVRYFVGKRQWENFGRELVRDMVGVRGLLETHLWLRPYGGLVAEVFERLKERYFQVLEGRWVDGDGGCGRGRVVVDSLLTTVEVWEEDEGRAGKK